MATVLLAIGSRILREACREQLVRAGHATLEVDRPLRVLGAQREVPWAAAVIDASDLGARTLQVLRERERIIGIGIEAPGLAWLRLPIAGPDLLSLVSRRASSRAGDALSRFTFEPERRLLSSERGSVRLSRIQTLLLGTLIAHAPAEVSALELMRLVWSYEVEDEAAGSELVRAHVPQLRLHLSDIDLSDLVRSRRGLGYYLEAAL